MAATRKPAQTEKQFTQTVLDTARTLGWRAYHTFDARHSAAGFPDLVLVRDGRLLFAELKVGKHQATVEQLDWLADLETVAHKIRPPGVSPEPPVLAVELWYPHDWQRILGLLK